MITTSQPSFLSDGELAADFDVSEVSCLNRPSRSPIGKFDTSNTILSVWRVGKQAKERFSWTSGGGESLMTADGEKDGWRAPTSSSNILAIFEDVITLCI